MRKPCFGLVLFVFVVFVGGLPAQLAKAWRYKFSFQCSMDRPYDVAVFNSGLTGKAYVSDNAANVVYVFDVSATGATLINVWTGFMGSVTGVAVDEARQHVYVTENIAGWWLLDVFDLGGTPLMQLKRNNTGSGESWGCDCDPAGNVYLTDRGLNDVAMYNASRFDPINYGLAWYLPADRSYTTGFYRVEDVSVDCCGHIHVTHDCNCYIVLNGVTGTIWSSGGSGGPHVPPGLFGVDAKLPAYGLGHVQSFVTAQHFVRSFDWDAMGTPTILWNITTGLNTPLGCETEVFSGIPRLFVCDSGNGEVKAYGP